LTHYKDLKHDVKYIIHLNMKQIVGTFQYIDDYHGEIKKAVFLSEYGYLIFIPFLSIVGVLETSSLEAELL